MTTPDTPAPDHAADRGGRAGTVAVILTVLLGALVAVGLGVYGRLHEPTFVSVNVAGFSSPQAVKSWLTTAAFALALVQLGSALVMYGRLPGVRAAEWTRALHRWAGRAAVLATVPVAVHCLYALGFDPSSPRVLAHSLAGCLFYGAFVTKMLVLGRRDVPRIALPVVGGVVFAALTALFLTSSVWFFTTFGITF